MSSGSGPGLLARACDHIAHVRRRLVNDGSATPQGGEAYFRALIEQAFDTITVLAADGTIRYQSPSVADVVGWQPQEMIGRGVMEFVHPRDQPKAMQELSRLVTEGGEVVLDVRFRTAAGGWKVLRSRGRSLLTEPAVRGVVVSAHDVTELVRRERHLAATQGVANALAATRTPEEAITGTLAALGSALDLCLGALWVADSPHAPLNVRRWWMADHVDAPDELAAAAAGDAVAGGIVAEAARRADAPRHADLAEVGGPLGEAARRRGMEHAWAVPVPDYPDGAVLEFLAAEPAIDEADVSDALVSAARDLSLVLRRQWAEGKLLRSETEFRALIENAHDIICVLDADLRFRYVSPATIPVLGVEPVAMADTSIAEWLHPDERSAARRLFVEAWSEPGRAYRAELRFRHASGEWRILETVLRVPPDDSVDGVVCNCRDVTERRLSEAALTDAQEHLRHAQKMEAVGRLAGAIAHDFNNLLTAIRGNADLLLSDLPEGSPSAGDAQEIRRATDRAVALTRQLLTFSRREPLEARALDLAALVAGMSEMLRRLMPPTVRLEISIGPGLPQVVCDPGQMEQVLMNLVLNAVDAMPEGGVVTISANPLTDRESSARGLRLPVELRAAVFLAVADTGTGIEPAVQGRLFEPFFTTKAAGRGTGLGLSTVYGIVTGCGGTIRVRSEPGRGSTFEMVLPAAGDAEAPASG